MLLTFLLLSTGEVGVNVDPSCSVSPLGEAIGSHFVVETLESCTVPSGHGSGRMHAPVLSSIIPPRFQQAEDESVELAT